MAAAVAVEAGVVVMVVVAVVVVVVVAAGGEVAGVARAEGVEGAVGGGAVRA